MTGAFGPLARADFDRIREGCDRIMATRRDGSTTSWTCPTYGGTIPHDLVHLVVESVFELRLGLWGSIAGGLDMEGVRERGRGPDGGELLTAEALAIVNWYDEDLDGERRCEAVLEACGELRAAPPVALDAARCDRATALLRAIKARCRDVAAHHGEADLAPVDGAAVHVRMHAHALNEDEAPARLAPSEP